MGGWWGLGGDSDGMETIISALARAACLESFLKQLTRLMQGLVLCCAVRCGANVGKVSNVPWSRKK